VLDSEGAEETDAFVVVSPGQKLFFVVLLKFDHVYYHFYKYLHFCRFHQASVDQHCNTTVTSM
jgi:hypothetical protein